MGIAVEESVSEHLGGEGVAESGEEGTAVDLEPVATTEGGRCIISYMHVYIDYKRTCAV